ncbi:uncharacterized transmembrane protein DDB_G0289901 [Folsomia candida]|uniref:uncharacterized transmembrane protein DDB_G0289901 n=1 Tax=Folsomia candida TaxID=158441 RepID=UPI0016051759|nr:uncharacterized transmembrane protein DDB_G0289901 [Folsomia candida]
MSTKRRTPSISQLRICANPYLFVSGISLVSWIAVIFIPTHTMTKSISNDLNSTIIQIIVTSHSFSHKANDDSTKDEMVTHINCYRACHSAPALTRDAQIESSQTDGYAQQLGASGSLQHSQSKYGENLYAGPRPSDAVDMWYFECNGNYNYGSNSNSMSCGHFTQLVWKGSLRIGLGIAKMAQYGFVVVANFDPPGNYLGNFANNVAKPDSACVSSCKSSGGGSSGMGNGGASNGGGNNDTNNGGMGGSGGNDGDNSSSGSWGGSHHNSTNNDNNGMDDDGWTWWGSGSGGNNNNNGSTNGNNHQNSTNWWGNGNNNDGGTNCGHNDNCSWGNDWLGNGNWEEDQES